MKRWTIDKGPDHRGRTISTIEGSDCVAVEVASLSDLRRAVEELRTRAMERGQMALTHDEARELSGEHRMANAVLDLLAEEAER